MVRSSLALRLNVKRVLIWREEINKKVLVRQIKTRFSLDRAVGKGSKETVTVPQISVQIQSIGNS